MKTLRAMVWKAVAVEMEAETPMTGPTFTLDDLVATTWELYHEELRAADLSKEDVQPVALEVLDHIEAHGWDAVRGEIQRAAHLRDAEKSEAPVRRPSGPTDPPF